MSNIKREMGNVLEFPKTRASAETVLEKIEKNRKESLERLEGKEANFEARDRLEDPETENAVRDLEGCIRATHNYLESEGVLVGMIQHDLVHSLQVGEEQAVNQFQTAAHLQVALAILKDKGLVTEEEMRAKWEEIITPQAGNLKS